MVVASRKAARLAKECKMNGIAQSRRDAKKSQKKNKRLQPAKKSMVGDFCALVNINCITQSRKARKGMENE